MQTLSSMHQTKPSPLAVPPTVNQQKTITNLKQREILKATPHAKNYNMSVFSIDVSNYNGSSEAPKILAYKQSARNSEGQPYSPSNNT